MFLTILTYEVKLLARSKWLLLLFSIVLLLLAFAAYNGTKNINKRLADIAVINQEFLEKDQQMVTMLQKIEAGEELAIPYWKSPSEPMTVGNRYPRLATMPPEALSFIATGQSDMYTHFKSPRIYGTKLALDYGEMVNPVQLLFGNFDIAFVIIYIIPLLIIAFTYNILSKEKELGTLRLLSSQPLSTFKWLLQKTGIRFVIFNSISSLILWVVITIFSLPDTINQTSLLGLLVLTSTYQLFWFVLSFIVAIKINNSSKNALTLIGLWLLLVLVIPATLNQLGNALYPSPSRLKMINEIRLIKKENEKNQDKIMDSYLRSHPELVEGSNQEQFGFWHNYFASEQAIEEKTTPFIKRYNSQLKKQQQLLRTFQFLSPALLMQQSLNNLAASSELHYNDFKKQVFEFSLKWRNFLVPMLFKQQKFSLSDYDELPKFSYKNNIKNEVWNTSLLLLFINGIVLIAFIGRRLLQKAPDHFLE